MFPISLLWQIPLVIYLFAGGVLLLIHWKMSQGNPLWARVLFSVWFSFWPISMYSSIRMLFAKTNKTGGGMQ